MRAPRPAMAWISATASARSDLAASWATFMTMGSVCEKVGYFTALLPVPSYLGSDRPPNLWLAIVASKGRRLAELSTSGAGNRLRMAAHKAPRTRAASAQGRQSRNQTNPVVRAVAGDGGIAR